ncbi:MAG: AMP-binding protein [Desulfomonilaceae bacterium]
MANVLKTEIIWRALKEAAQDRTSGRGYTWQGSDLTFKEVDERSDHVAAGLLNLGFQKGDRIGIIALNQPEWVYTYFAAAKIGAVVVGLSVRYRETELNYILNHSKARAIVTLASAGDMNYVQFFRELKERIPSVRDFIFIDHPRNEESHDYQALLQAPVDRAALEAAQGSVSPDDLIMIIYTSGTTGKPKGAGITHRSQLASARAEAKHIRADPGDSLQLALPFNHVGGITCGLLTMLVARGTCHLIPMFDPKTMIKQAASDPPSLFVGVPTMHTLMLLNEGMKDFNKDSVRLVITGGSNAEPPLLKQLYETFPKAKVMNLYGLSETSGTVIMSPWDSDFEATIRSIGKPLGDFNVKVRGTDGVDVPIGEIGEILIKGDCVIPRYFRMPQETVDTFGEEGWLRTGDMGYLDENGYITLMGRLKEMYVQGGFNVYPVEVENLIAKHPKVAMVAGIGVPDAVLGEIGRFYIVPKPGTTMSERELLEYCRSSLADYKVPRQVVFVDSLPLTPVGKIMKSKLKEDYLQQTA